MSHGEFGRLPTYGTLASSNAVANFGHSSRYQDGGGERFQNLSDMVSINIDQIKKNTAVLEETLKQFTESKGGQQERLKGKAKNEFQKTKDIVTKTLTYLKEMFRLCGRNSPSARQRQVQFQKLKDEFWESILPFSSIQNREDGSKNGDDFGTEKSNLLENDLRRQAKQEQIREHEERWRQIKIDIIDFTAISRDLATMVHEQGDTVDDVERRVNVRRAPGNVQQVIYVEETIVQPRKAEEQPKKYRAKKCILLLVFVFVATVIGVIICLTV